MTSVALCTYNGEKYIEEQISSILNQSVPVDEIVVCDDGSTDNTLVKIEGFQPRTKTNIRIYRNEKQLGVCANFQKAVDLCTGDIIFLSDQDDVWRTDKVEITLDFFRINKRAKVVFTDAQLISDNSNYLNEMLWKCLGLSDYNLSLIDKGLGIELFAFENRATGATMALKRDFEYIHSFIDYCAENILHDGAIAMLALNNSQLGYITKCLIEYRIHERQKCGIGDSLDVPLCNNPYEISHTAEIWGRMQLPSVLEKRISFLLNRRHWCQQRYGVIHILHSWSEYRKNYYDIWSDFFLYDIKKWCKSVERSLLNK